MATRDHLLGYAPAAGEWFGDDGDTWEWFNGPWPLGAPKRILDEYEARRRNIELTRTRALKTPIMRIDHRYSTPRDVVGSAVKRQLALDAARPFADAMGLHIETVSEVRNHQTGELTRHVANYEPDDVQTPEQCKQLTLKRANDEYCRSLAVRHSTVCQKIAEADRHACQQERRAQQLG